MDTHKTDKNSFNEPSLLDTLELGAVDPILSLLMKFRTCTDPDKINLTAGTYRDEELKNYVFHSVRKAEEELLTDSSLTRDYMPQLGDEQFNQESRKLFFENEHELVKKHRVVSVQSASGSGALRFAFEIIRKTKGKGKTVYLPDPTFINHPLLSEHLGFKTLSYEYFDPQTLGIKFESLLKALDEAEEESIFVMHTCAFNPCSSDLSDDQWKTVAAIAKKKKHFFVMDTAYPGFASGKIKEDVKPLEILANEGIELAICQSYSKNMGLYGERAGSFHLVFADQGKEELNKETHRKIRFTLEQIALSLYIVPVKHAAEVIKGTLTKHKKEWEEELAHVVGRLHKMRRLLFEELQRIKCPGNWDHIAQQTGMFAFTGMSPSVCKYLIEKKNVFVLMNGRISICGLNTKNIPIAASCIKEALLNN